MPCEKSREGNKVMTEYSIEASIDESAKTVVKRSTRSVIVNNGVVFLNDIGINANEVDFTQEHTITLRIKPVP